MSKLDELIQKSSGKLEEISAQLASLKANAVESIDLANVSTQQVQTKLAEASEFVSQIETLKEKAANEHAAAGTSIQTAISVISESQAQVSNLLSDVQNKAAEAAALATQLIAVKTQVTDDQAVIASKSDHIQKAQEHADKIRAELDRKLTEAGQFSTEAEGLKVKAQSSSENAAAALAEIRAAKATADTELQAANVARKEAESFSKISASLAEKANTVEVRIAGYEQKLEEFRLQSEEQLEKIEALLRGATTAGLAHFFDDRRQAFVRPQGRWQWVYIGSLVAIVVLAVTGIWRIYVSHEVPTYDELFRLWLARLPIAGALIWLALYASRESALAKRLEEDYGFKAAIASCFEGFRKQMVDIGSNVPADSALARLCENTLTTIAMPPGRIYDKHKLTVSPSDELRQLAKAAADAAKGIRPLG